MEITYTVRVPGKFATWFSGTGVAQGENMGHDRADHELHDAWSRAFTVPAGSSATTVVTGLTKRAITSLIDYAGFCLDSNCDEPDRSEMRAARQVIARCKAVLGGAS